MTKYPVRFLLAAVVFAATISLPAAEPANGKAAPNAASVMTEMRIRQMTKALQLTDDQQKKIRALLAVETEKIAKVDEAGVDLATRTEKVTAIKKETQASIRPILTVEQVAKLDAQVQQAEKRKRKS